MSTYYNNNNNNNNNNKNNVVDEDYSESQTTMNPEQFEDEPGNNNNNHGGASDNAPYRNENHNENDDQYDNRYQINDDDNENENGRYQEPTNDPYGAPSQQSRSYQPNNHNHNNNNNYDYDDDAQEQEQAPGASIPPPERKHKYSTANLREQGKWKKWCQILLLFLFMIAVIGLSMLMNHFFFGDQSDNGPKEPIVRNTFPEHKEEVDDACGESNKTLCTELCVPDYFHCCDPFDEFVLYNYTKPTNSTNYNLTNSTDLTNSTNPIDDILSSVPDTIPDQKNLTFMDGYDKADTEGNEQCSFDMDVRGCMAYAKCHALVGQIDPSKGILSDTCSMNRLVQDADSCTDMCKLLKCCYSTGNDNCLAEKFDLCMDYAPCQNLRRLTAPNPDSVLVIAPPSLDFDCHQQEQTCTETCETARCCSEAGEYSCLQNNFISCMTYSPCSAMPDSNININVTQQFSFVPQPSIDLVHACDAHQSQVIIEPSDRSCEDICSDAACCWADGDDNCFHLDPLGCLAYEAQCQALQPDARK